jgi:hypothetical protein
MNIQLRDLINITDASVRLKVDLSELLFDALEGKLTLFVVASKDVREALVPLKKSELHHASPGEFIPQYEPLLGDIEYVDIKLGQALEVNEQSIKNLIVNQQFSEAELYRQLAPIRDDLKPIGWKTEREVYDWEEDLPPYSTITVEQVHILKSEVSTNKASHGSKGATTDVPSNTSLKVIGLLMHQLAKSPKYASGTSPNKSQIKELLLDLAEELGINPYGLSKVDERVLADALKYLETQKA